MPAVDQKLEEVKEMRSEAASSHGCCECAPGHTRLAGFDMRHYEPQKTEANVLIEARASTADSSRKIFFAGQKAL